MKKIKLFLIACALFASTNIWAWEGSGTSGSPYLIASADDWNTLATSGTNYSGQFFKLTNNISVTTMISGTFSGTFDGNGHTLTVTLSGGGNLAPFQYLNGGTIKGLTVAGTVTASANFSSGLVARATGGTCLIDNCVVNANITGVGYIGGILAYNDGATSMTITNCIYGGTISITPSGDANYTGGIFGWYNDSNLDLVMTNCLFKGTYSGNGQFHPIGVKKNAATFAGKSCTNCFYTANPQYASGDRIFTSGTKVCTLTIGTDGVSIATGSYATFQNTKYYYGDITLAYNNADATVTYKLNGNAISGNSFTINTGTNFTSGTATITADVTYDITYDLDGGTLDAPQQTYTNPSTYKPTDAAITLRNPHKDGYAFYGWTGTGVGGTRRAQVNVTIPAGSHGNRTYTADFRQYTEGPWSYVSTATGWCSTTLNASLSYDGLIYNTVWMNPYPWQDGTGFGFTQWGTSGNNGNKYGLYSIFKTEQAISSYTRKVLHWNYNIASYATKFHQTVALYVHDDMATLKAAAVDMTADYTNASHGAVTCIGHKTQTTTSPTSQPSDDLSHDFEFDNRNGSSDQTMTKAMLLTQVIASTETGVEMHHWGGFKNMSMTWDTYYYKYLTYDANGGEGTMSNQTIENGDTLRTNTLTRAHKIFDGWSDGVNNYTNQDSIFATLESKGPVTLYAQWADAPAAEVTSAPAAVANLVYDGSSKALITAGTASGGEMQYSLDGENWSTDVPTAVDGGNYTVYYKVVADYGHSDSQSESVQVHINYTISYDLADGTVATPNPTNYNETTADFMLTNPTRYGYDFAGWTGTGLSEATMSVTIAQGSTGNRSYTATWAAKPLDADRVNIGDLYYNLRAAGQTAEVTSQSEAPPFWTTSITTANIPESVVYLGTTYSVTGIGERAFYNCSSLTSVTIPNSVVTIGNYAFQNCTGLTSVTIGNSVTSIGKGAFYGCENLSSLTIPDNVTSIGERAFEDCKGLTSVTIPGSVTRIEGYTFMDCSGLTSVTIPSSVTGIGSLAFYGCSGLTSFINYATTPQSIGTDVFINASIASCTLYVPAESVAAYKAANVWKNFYNIAPISVIPTAVDTIQEHNAQTTKILRNGMLLIVRDGRMFDLTGVQVR